MKTTIFAVLCALLACPVDALTLVFHEDSPAALDFEMSNVGPTPGDQSVTSPSGTWFIYAFVYQFDAGDEFAEIGGFIKKLLPAEEAIGTDVIFPQIYGPPDFPLMQTETGEFGDKYVGAFQLLPGSGADAQEWDWVMTLKTTESDRPSTIPDSGTSVVLAAVGILAMLGLTRTRLFPRR